jgi:hyperosmotically inducible protein
MHSKLIATLMAAALSTATMSAFANEPQQDGAMAGAIATSSDSALTAKVKAALDDQKQINVSIKQGVVILSGAVPSTDAGTKAIQAASAVDGVKEVKSELTVAQISK